MFFFFFSTSLIQKAIIFSKKHFFHFIVSSTPGRPTTPISPPRKRPTSAHYQRAHLYENTIKKKNSLKILGFFWANFRVHFWQRMLERKEGEEGERELIFDFLILIFWF